MNLHGNNSLLTGANASGKSTLIGCSAHADGATGSANDFTINHRVWRRRATVQRNRTSCKQLWQSAAGGCSEHNHAEIARQRGSFGIALHRSAMWTSAW